MKEFVVRLETRHPPSQAWSRLWDLERHTALIPLTTVALAPPAELLAEGVGFVGRTAVGALGFDDPMRVMLWSPPGDGPGRARVDKTGRVLGGRIDVEVAPTGTGAVVTWRQVLELPWLPRRLRVAERIGARLAAPGYRWVLRRLLA